MKRLLLLFLCSVNGLFSIAQDSTKQKSYSLKVLPIAFYSPDTRLGGGAAGIITFNVGKGAERAKTSSITFGLAYTQLNQTLIYLPFNLFTKNNQFWLFGEIGYYDYIFNYFGVGNKVPNAFIEKYDARFPRIRINALRQINPELYIGIRYGGDIMTISNYQLGNNLENGEVLGYDGGRFSSLGLSLNYDTRDALFYPTDGLLFQSSAFVEREALGSDFNCFRLDLDFASYHSLSSKDVIAMNAVFIHSAGEVPFQQMASLGGTKRLRGYFDGKYRDQNLVLIQSEWRRILSPRWGAVVFGGLGQVSSSLDAFKAKHWRPNAGLGVRFALDKEKRINARLDFGVGEQGASGFYLTVNEAF